MKLKLPEPDVSSEKPWQDDVLNRKEIASRLTNIIRNQSLPFVISIHGEWGTGKTFMLRRWQRDLENQDFKAIYFNAWEDDFCEDPLLAIIGQLWSYFEKDKEGRFEGFLKKIRENAGPLIRANINSLVRKYIGVTGEVGPSKQDGRDLVDEYLHQTSTKDTLKKSLGSMVEAVVEETGHPLIFVIDELDRCRPTFAIELLERVKHIFDVPNVVFVLGINRNELCKSLQSVYGEIDADVYLKRFFDMEFTLPEVDTAQFCGYLMRRFGIGDFFLELGKNDIFGLHQGEVQKYQSFFPQLWSSLGFSLRDMDYCVRSIAFLGNSIRKGITTLPWLLGLLIGLKLKNPSLYRQFVQHDCLAGQLMDYIDDFMPSNETMPIYLSRGLDTMEGWLYGVESDFQLRKQPVSVQHLGAVEQLRLLQNGDRLIHPEFLSRRTVRSGSERASSLLKIVDEEIPLDVPGDAIGYVARLIDLYQIRR